jgi:hypothetical protein
MGQKRDLRAILLIEPVIDEYLHLAIPPAAHPNFLPEN